MALTTRELAGAERIARRAPNHHAVAASTTTPNAINSDGRAHRAYRRCGGRWAAGAPAPSGTSRALRNCWIEAKRSAGSFAMARTIAVSNALGTVCLTTRRLGTGSARCLAMTACVVGPVNGGSPINISYTVHAMLY